MNGKFSFGNNLRFYSVVHGDGMVLKIGELAIARFGKSATPAAFVGTGMT